MALIKAYVETLEATMSQIEENKGYFAEAFEVSEDEVDDMMSAYDDVVELYEDIKISAAYEVEVEFVIKGEDEEDDFELDLVIAKVDGNWIMIKEGQEDMWNFYVLTPDDIVDELKLEADSEE